MLEQSFAQLDASQMEVVEDSSKVRVRSPGMIAGALGIRHQELAIGAAVQDRTMAAFVFGCHWQFALLLVYLANQYRV